MEENSVIRKFRITASDGKNYLTNLYNLDAIIAVGYRVNSHEATRFRIWATKIERIREIRASERRFYQKITDIYAQCSIDYDPKSEVTQTFYKTVQNKLHWAITGHTAAELIAERANAAQPNMGLTTWKNAPKGKILKTDVTIAKNYLSEKEIDELNRIVNMYLDYAENQAKRHKVVTMKEWAEKLDSFLQAISALKSPKNYITYTHTSS